MDLPKVAFVVSVYQQLSISEGENNNRGRRRYVFSRSEIERRCSSLWLVESGDEVESEESASNSNDEEKTIQHKGPVV